MRKLKLNIDDLKVESFKTTLNDINPKGTVIAYGTVETDVTNCCSMNCSVNCSMYCSMYCSRDCIR